jgi:hypothetical protein
VAKRKYLSFFENIFQNIYLFLSFCIQNFLSTNFFIEEKVKKQLFLANRDSKTARIRQTETNPCKIGQICQKLGVRQKYFLPARRLSNSPEFCKSDGENRHLATLRHLALLRVFLRAGNFRLSYFPKQNHSFRRESHFAIPGKSEMLCPGKKK